MRNPILLGILAAAIPLGAMAQDGAGSWQRTAGDREFTLAGTGSSDKDFDNSTMGLSFGYGKYFTDRWLISLQQGLNYADVPGDNVWNGSTRVGADYHFGQGRLKAFLGGRIGGVYGDRVKESAIAGPAFGLKYYAKSDTFIYAQAEYQYFFEEADDIDDNFDDGSFVHSIGIGFNF